MPSVQELADEHVAAFNDAVASGDFTTFLARFDDSAVMRFESAPGAGALEFDGRPAIATGYARQPPDDQIRIAGAVREEDGAVVIPFAWRRDGAPGVIRLKVHDGLVSRMVVTFA